MSTLRAIASEIDRLVLAVNQTGAPASLDAVARSATELGLSTPAAFKHFSEWLLTIGVPERVAIARVPYFPEGALAERIAEWRELGVVREEAGRLHAEAALRPLLEAIVDARAEAAAGFWSGHDRLDEAARIIASVVDGLGSELVVAHDHAQVPLPDHPGLAFHQQLTTLRYARAAAHVEAWKAAGLTRDDVLALSSLWRDEPVTRGTTDRLVTLGLVEGDRVTDEGRRLRERIEDDTDARNAPVFAGIDGPGLVAVLTELPPT